MTLLTGVSSLSAAPTQSLNNESIRRQLQIFFFSEKTKSTKTSSPYAYAYALMLMLMRK